MAERSRLGRCPRLVRRGRLAGDELDRTIDEAFMAMPTYRQAAESFQSDWDRLNLVLGYTRPLRYG